MLLNVMKPPSASGIFRVPSMTIPVKVQVSGAIRVHDAELNEPLNTTPSVYAALKNPPELKVALPELVPTEPVAKVPVSRVNDPRHAGVQVSVIGFQETELSGIPKADSPLIPVSIPG